MSELPPNWIECRIGEVAEIISGGTPPSKDSTNFSAEDGHSWITPADLSGYKDIYISRGARNLTEKGLRNSSAKLIPAGSVLFSSRAPVGYVAIAKNELATNQGFKNFILPDELESRFIYYYLRHIKPIAESMATGTTFKELSGTKAAQLPLLLAPLNEQKRIADKLDSLMTQVDACQVHLDRVPQILKRFRQSVLAAATFGKLTEEWRDTRGISLHSWNTKTGDEIFSLVTSGSRGWATYYADAGAKFLRVGNLDRDTIEIDLGNIQYVSPPVSAEGQRTKIEVGDILISITADVGMIGFVHEDIGDAYINQHICLARQNGNYLGEYLAYFLASPIGGQPQLLKAQRGVTKAGLTLGDIKAITFQLPTLDEQYEIARIIKNLFALADSIEARWQRTQEHLIQLTPSLLAKAFRGELVDQDPNDEPALAILERIRMARENAPKEPKKPRLRTDMTTAKAEKDDTRPGVIQALKTSDRELSAQELFQLAGYPSDAEPEMVEEFFVEVRDALKNQQIDKKRRHETDWFSLPAP